MVHIQGQIYRERGFLTAEGKEIKNLPEIHRLLEAVQMPRAVSIVHVPGHQKGDSPTARGNRAADLAARKVADEDFITPVLAIGLPPPGMGTLPPTPEYSSTDFTWIQKHTNLQKDKDGWYRDSDGYLILPAQLGRQLCEHLHLSTHLGEKKTLMLSNCASAISLAPDNCKEHSACL